MSRVSAQHAEQPTAPRWAVMGNLASALLVVLAVACARPAPSAPRDLGTSRRNDGPAAPPGPPAAVQDSRQSVPTASPGPRTTVHVATVGAVSDRGIYLAMDRGYFAAEGLELELSQTEGGPRIIPALSTGQVDVAGVSTGAAFFNAWSRDIPIRIVADKGRMSPGHGFFGLVVRQDLVDGGVFRDLSELRGWPIAVNLVGSGTIGDSLTDKLLTRGGLDRDAVTLVDLSYPDMAAALASRAVDAALLIEPLMSVAVSRRLATRWLTLDEISPDYQIAVLLYSPQFAATDAARRFMVAYLRGVRDSVDAFDHGRDRDEVVAALTRYTTVRDPAIYDAMVMAGLNPDGYVNTASVAEDIDYYTRHGYALQHPDPTAVIDNQFVDYAIKQLGPYRP